MADQINGYEFRIRIREVLETQHDTTISIFFYKVMFG